MNKSTERAIDILMGTAEHDKQIRAKAIDEYKAKIKEYCSIAGSCDLEDLDKIAEQLKEKTNE